MQKPLPAQSLLQCAIGAASATGDGQDSEFICACEEGDESVAIERLREGAGIRKPGAYNMSALHIAVLNNHVNLAKEIIAIGTEIDARENNGWTPAAYAAFVGHLEILLVLLDAGAAQERVTAEAESTLERLGISNGHPEVAGALAAWRANQAIRVATDEARSSRPRMAP